MKKKGVRSLLTTALAIIPAAGVIVFLFCKAGSWLVVTDPLPGRLDIIFTFAGDNLRITYSRELMGRYPEARWVISDYFHRYSRILSRDGFDMSRVALVDTCPYTFLEVKGLADWLHDKRNVMTRQAAPDTGTPRRNADAAAEPLQVALVSSPYHLRRVKCMVEKVFSVDAIRFYYLPVPLERYHWTSRDFRYWWRSKALRAKVGSEIGKLLVFWFFT